VRSSSWAEPGGTGLTWPDVLGSALVGLSEGAWITVLYVLIETVGHADSPLGLPIFAGVAFLGALAGPRLDQLGEGRWRVMTLVSVAVGLAGMVIGRGVLAGLLAGDPGRSFGAEPGGWLLGVAAFRGMLGGGSLDDPEGATRPVVRGVILLGVAWLYAGLLPAASQAAFRSAGLLPTFLFVAAGIGSAALRRVEAISLSTGTQWWRNRAWLVIVAMLLVGLTLLALPLARWLAATEPGVLGLNGFPELVVIVAFVALILVPVRDRQRPNRLSARGAIVLAVLFVIVAFIYRMLHSQDTSGPVKGGGAGSTGADAGNPVMGVFILAWVIAGVALVTILVARNWRRSRMETDVSIYRDEADFELRAPGSGWLRRAAARLRQLRPDRRPRTAEAAYLAALKELEPLQSRRRLDLETPAAHARRLHREGAGSLELDLLAADYELSHWGARTMTEPETRRAIGRWERSQARFSAWIAAEQAERAHAEAQEIKNLG
jgi:hypothetical protein